MGISKALAVLVFTLSIVLTMTFYASADNTKPAENDNGSTYEEATEDTSNFKDLTESFRPKMSITLNSDFVINVYIPVKSTVNFTFDGVLYENLENYESTAIINEELYYKVTKELPAPEAAQEIPLSVSADFDGTSLVGSFVFSIPKYAANVLNSSSSEIEKTLVKDALSYISGAVTMSYSTNGKTMRIPDVYVVR